MRHRLAGVTSVVRLGRAKAAIPIADEIVHVAEGAGDRGLIAEARFVLARAQEAAGQDDAAIASFEQAIRAADGAGLDEVRFASWDELGYLVGEIRADRARGQDILDEERALADRLPPDPARASMVLERAAGLHWTHGDYPACLDEATRAEELTRKADPDNLSLESNRIEMIGLCEERMHHDREAMARFEQTLALRRRAYGDDHPTTAISYNNLASVANSLGDYAAAERDHRRSLEIRERVLGPDHRDTAQSHNNLANTLIKLGKPDEAYEHAKRANEIWTAAVGPRTPLAATSMAVMGHAEEARGHLREAEALYRGALAIRLEVRGPNHADVTRVLGNLATVLVAEGRVADAIAVADDAYARTAARGDQGAALASAQLDHAKILAADPGRRAAAMEVARAACPLLAGADWKVELADCDAFVGRTTP